VADAAGGKPNKRLAGPGLLEVDLLDGERPSELLEDRSADLHTVECLKRRAGDVTFRGGSRL
jgi:hypothetical protein